MKRNDIRNRMNARTCDRIRRKLMAMSGKGLQEKGAYRRFACFPTACLVQGILGIFYSNPPTAND